MSANQNFLHAAAEWFPGATEFEVNETLSEGELG